MSPEEWSFLDETIKRKKYAELQTAGINFDTSSMAVKIPLSISNRSINSARVVPANPAHLTSAE